MPDFLTKDQRSQRMASIRGKNTSPEVLFRKALHHTGLRYRLHPRDLPGKPDIVLPKYKTVIFVNGCFWHGHVCQKGRVPATNSDFWRDKVSNNRKRDARNIRILRNLGWKVIIVWECHVRTKSLLEKSAERVIKYIWGQSRFI